MSWIVRTSFITQDIMNYVNDNIYWAVVDNILRSNVIFQVLMSRRQAFTWKNLVINFKYKLLWNGGWFRWFDKLNINTTDTTKQLAFNPSYFSQPVVFSWTDLSVASNKQTVIDYMVTRFAEVTQEIADVIWTSMYWANYANDKIMLWLKDLIDDGSTVATYGWLNRADFLETNAYRIWIPSQIGWNKDTSWWALTLARLEAMWRAVTSWRYRPDLIMTTKNLKYKIQTLSPTTNQYVTVPTSWVNRPLYETTLRGWLVAQAWFTDVYFKWIPVIEDEKCPEWELYMLSLETFELRVFDTLPDTTPIKVTKWVIEWQYDKNFDMVSTWFHRSPTLQPYDQYATVTHIFFAWQMICKQPKYNWYFVNLT